MNEKWIVNLSRLAQKELNKLQQPLKRRVEERIDRLVILENPFSISKELQGKFKGYRSTRVGEVRIIFAVSFASRTIDVVMIDYRGPVYKNLRRRL